MQNNKLNKLNEKAKKQFYSNLTYQLFDNFALRDSYKNEVELQNDFRDLRDSDIKSYREMLDYILKTITDGMKENNECPDDLDLTWRDFTKLTYQKFHLCECCDEPFIDISRNGRARYCYHTTYKRWSSNGTMFKMSHKASECQAQSYRNKSKRYYYKKAS